MTKPNESYSAQSEAEGIVLAAACVAANKVFDRVIYKSHGISKSFTVLEDGKREDSIPLTSLPKGATVYQFWGVSFVGPGHYFFIITLEGRPTETGAISWKIVTVAAPGREESVLTEGELEKFNSQ